MEKRLAKYTFATILLAFIETGIILFILLVSIENRQIQQIIEKVSAVLFWICVIVEIAAMYLGSKERYQIEQKGYRSRSIKNSKIGIVSFLKNREAIIVDIVLILFALITVILTCFKVEVAWVVTVNISILFLSFNLHCIFNGKNYRYLKMYKHYIKEHRRDE